MAAPALVYGQDLGTSRRVQGAAKVTTVEVGDVPGHVVGVVSFFADSEIATHTNAATVDLTETIGSGMIRAGQALLGGSASSADQRDGYWSWA